jgi:hypothetical protein
MTKSREIRSKNANVKNIMLAPYLLFSDRPSFVSTKPQYTTIRAIIRGIIATERIKATCHIRCSTKVGKVKLHATQ